MKTKQKSDKATLILLSMYFILKPFYLWESGLPQVSDLVLTAAIILYIVGNGLKLNFLKGSKQFVLVNVIFVFYITFINILWSLLLGGEKCFFTASMFYVFNFMTLSFIISLYSIHGRQIYRLVYFSVLASIALQFVILLLSGGFAGNRAMAYFNNPNQLGYHSLLTLALLLFLGGKLNIKGIWLITGIIVASALCLASLSKAAIISFFGMLLYFVLLHIKDLIFARNTNKTIFILLFIVAALLTAYKCNNEAFNSNILFQSVGYRLSTIGQSNDDNLSQRGYDRLFAYQQYLLFGAGEGIYSRFGSTAEFHSTLGNILMSYGIVGISLYMAILSAVCIENRREGLYIIGFVTLYGLTHNGIRNTLFWIMTALIYSNGKKGNDI